MILTRKSVESEIFKQQLQQLLETAYSKNVFKS